MVDNGGILRIAAGNGELGAGGDGGPALNAALGRPDDVAVSDSGTLYIADPFSSLIRKVTSDGIITTIAGTGSEGYNGDGSPATDHHLRFPNRVAAYSDRRVLATDALNHRIGVLTVDLPPPKISSVLSGAGYFTRLAPGSVGAVRGADLSSHESAATALPQSDPLPTSLLATSVILTESPGQGSVKRRAGLYSVSPTEIRFRVPEEAEPGQTLVLGPVPRSIRNREVEVVAIVDGQNSNAVTIAFE